MRVLVSVDMEGVAGVVATEDIRPGNGEYERARLLMTDEASAAVRGVLAADPDASIVVADAHASFRNLVPERLERRCRLLRGSPRTFGMLTGVEREVGAVLMIGYHGRAGTPASVLAHTVSGGTIAAVRCNGEELGEFGLNVALAAYFGAGTVLASGDDTLAREASALLPGVATVTVKWSYGSQSAASLHPSEACAQIEAAAQTAVAGAAAAAPGLLEGPVDLEVDMLRPGMTERSLMIPGVERRGAVTLGFRAVDIRAAYDLIEVFAVLAAAP